MNPEQLFSLALGLVPPWMVDDVTFKVEDKRLDLHIDFPKGSRFACPVCGQECPVHDTADTVLCEIMQSQILDRTVSRI